MTKIVSRSAASSDSPRIASLHAESWRTTYRSILPDSYLDQEIFKERERFWKERFWAPGTDRRYVLLAELGRNLVGFVCALLDEEPEWGACLENLHVSSKFQGFGLGRQLFCEATRRVIAKESD